MILFIIEKGLIEDDLQVKLVQTRLSAVCEAMERFWFPCTSLFAFLPDKELATLPVQRY